MPNRLADETSPYLLQHKDNPVEWYPWGEEALARARAEDRPIFLSIGYSACHWCHVMAHESFEDPETAALMNAHFVNIKVDREERPDLDSIYMNAVQALTGGGGWPMSVWLLPDGRPFFGGTYFPRNARYGMPSFREVLSRVARVFSENRAALERDAGNLTRAISRVMDLNDARVEAISSDTLHVAFQKIAEQYDEKWGGFGSQPKFPPSMTLELLFRLYQRFGWQHALAMATHTLDRMARGGMYDQLGGGFHRYSVDGLWLVPHFEKMLYDNALLIRAYLSGYQITGKERYRQVVEEITAYVLREMTGEAGGFFSAQDADSEGEEGRYFIWREEAVRALLDGRVRVEPVLDYWGLKDGPNFEGQNVLWVPEPPEAVAARHGCSVEELLQDVGSARAVLFEHREKRVKPLRDDKILSGWNGLMITSLSRAGRALGRRDITAAAVRAAEFVLGALRRDGRLLRAYRAGQAKHHGYLEDYAFMGEALLELYQTTFDTRWYREAAVITEAMCELFWDEDAGFYDTAHDQDALITRPQEITDNAVPAGQSGAVALLLRMALLANRPDWQEKAERVLARMSDAIQAYPSAFAYLAAQLDFLLSAPHEIALIGEPDSAEVRALLEVVNGAYRPNQVVALRSPDDAQAAGLIPLLAGRDALAGRATAYVCRHAVCRLPVTDPDSLRQQLDSPASR